jgi:hypothetical protein
MTSVATMTTDRIPPGWSTGSVASFTWLGMNRQAMYSATTASGRVMKKTELQSKPVSRAPARSGPRTEIPPPSADHRAIVLVRPGPAQRAVIRASVVGNAIPAARPPSRRAANSTPMDGANPARSDAGIARPVPAISIILRP